MHEIAVGPWGIEFLMQGVLVGGEIELNGRLWVECLAKEASSLARAKIPIASSVIDNRASTSTIPESRFLTYISY